MLTDKVSSKNQGIWLYVTLFISWVAFCITITCFFISTSIRDSQSDFIQFSNAYSEHIYDKVNSNKIILNGFAALLGALGNGSSKDASIFARQVIEDYPHIFSLEIVQTVPGNGLAKFALQQRKAGHPNFKIKTFGYDTDRKWHNTENKPVYYPIVFMEPMRPGTEEIIGLDIGSVPLLHPVILNSIQKQGSVSSPPFHLVEGNLAYVIFMPVRLKIPLQKNSMAENPALTVDMVVDANKMGAPDNMSIPKNLHLVVYHSDFSPEDVGGQIVHIHQPPHSAFEEILFPNFRLSKEIDPFLNILVEKQLGWSDVKPGLLLMIVLASLISSAILLAFMRTHYRSTLAEKQSQQQLWFLANHDVLTRLPNRNLFMNRMEHAIARAQRQGRNFGILFLDLNGFKQINDFHGHHAGDLLLKQIATRLQACIRAEDSVARLGGDEFVVLLEGKTDAEVMESIAQKIRDSLSIPITINNQQFTISASIGKATFPMNGKTADELLKHADAKMYAEKHPPPC